MVLTMHCRSRRRFLMQLFLSFLAEQSGCKMVLTGRHKALPLQSSSRRRFLMQLFLSFLAEQSGCRIVLTGRHKALPLQSSSRRRFLLQVFFGFEGLISRECSRTNKKPDFEPGIRPCFAGVNTSCGKIRRGSALCLPLKPN